jgi:hypothetical protein
MMKGMGFLLYFFKHVIKMISFVNEPVSSLRKPNLKNKECSFMIRDQKTNFVQGSRNKFICHFVTSRNKDLLHPMSIRPEGFTLLFLILRKLVDTVFVSWYSPIENDYQFQLRGERLSCNCTRCSRPFLPL